MRSMFAPVAAPERKGDRIGSAALLAAPLVLALPVFALWGILLFAAQGAEEWWRMRGLSELLVWQLPLAVWLATLVAVVALAVRGRRALPSALLGASVIGLSMLAALALPLIARAS